MDETLPRAVGNRDGVEKPTRPRPLLADGQLDIWAPVAVAGSVGAPLRDGGQEDLRCERGVDATGVAEAISGDATQDE
jgi:hypothetical protein